MKHFLLVIDAQKGFMVDGITNIEQHNVECLLQMGKFDCVISSVYRNVPDSPIIRLMGWNKLLTSAEQEVLDARGVVKRNQKARESLRNNDFYFREFSVSVQKITQPIKTGRVIFALD